jgi:ABC-type amino acid transport system permease subunit
MLLTARVEIIRGTPLLLQLFVLYFGLATVVQLPALFAGPVCAAIYLAMSLPIAHLARRLERGWARRRRDRTGGQRPVRAARRANASAWRSHAHSRWGRRSC